MSKTREKQWWKYLSLRTEFLATHPNCQFKGCTSLASDVHHRKGKIGKLLLNRRYWLAVCRPCHCWIEANKREARKLKYILYSLLLYFLYSTAYADLGYADNDGNLLPLGTGTPRIANLPKRVAGPVAQCKQEIFETPSEIFARVELEYAPWYPVPDFL